MDKILIICFSPTNEKLNRIINEIPDQFDSVFNLLIFQDEHQMLKTIESNICLKQRKQIFIIDPEVLQSEHNDLIKNINRFCRESVKLIITRELQSADVKISDDGNKSVLYLKQPFKSEELKVVLQKAVQLTSNSDTESFSEDDPILNLKIEQKVNERLRDLIDSNREKDSFLSVIAHDLKSPFVAMKGFSEILLNDWQSLSEETKLELINDLHNTSEETFKLLETLLEWTKLQKEKPEITISEVKIHDLVESTLKIAKNNALLKGIRIQNKIDKNIKVRTDEKMISAIFRNLISNAVQYTPSEGRIEITGWNGSNFYTFCVSDNGSGIDKPQLLEFFERGSGKKINGNASKFNGFGLIICKDFVEKTGGQIWLETEKGKGSKFFFTVPC